MKQEGAYYKLHMDGWAAYNGFDFNAIKREPARHVHGKPGSEKRDMQSSNLSEGLWGEIKTELRRTYITLKGSINWIDFVYEAMWKIEIRKLPAK